MCSLGLENADIIRLLPTKMRAYPSKRNTQTLHLSITVLLKIQEKRQLLCLCEQNSRRGEFFAHIW